MDDTFKLGAQMHYANILEQAAAGRPHHEYHEEARAIEAHIELAQGLGSFMRCYSCLLGSPENEGLALGAISLANKLDLPLDSIFSQ